MQVNLFYEPELEPLMTVMSKEESHHCVKVLRHKKGDKLQITNGKGLLCNAVLDNPDPKACEIEITDNFKDYGKRPYNLHIAIAPTKSIDRFEWFLEKATECGIDQITPVLCEKSERRIIKPARLEKLLIAAMKQSCRAYLPKLNPLVSFSEFLKTKKDGCRLIAHCVAGDKYKLEDLYKSGNDVIAAIGPEGDFTQKEVDMALSVGFKAITMGKHRLRTETAALSACIQINTINGLL